MESFLDRIGKLPHKKLTLLAAELYQRSLSAGGAAEPVAITAMACRFPGGYPDACDTPEAFWSFLNHSGDAIGQIPEERLAMTGTVRADLTGKGASWGAFLPGVSEFDPAVFGISAREAESMDPQQRVLLEVCWEALENAGTPIDALDSLTGVFMGVSGFDYALLNHGTGREQNGYAVTGVANAVLAGRISYVFGFNGPSTVVDTACSASASAIHLACQSLRARECDQAIAGGINLLLLPQITQTVAGLESLASDGRCKAFAADADGFVRGEGCGVIVLRRLSEATARGEPILGVIRGSAWNQDGKSGGLTAPNGAAQERVIRAALSNAKLTPDQISYVEAHGTGTALGDPIEVSALGRVFTTEHPRAAPLVVGSVKTNVGHLEAAAGVAGVIKVLLALRHGRIPPHLHAAALNPQVHWPDLPLLIPTQGIAWPRGTEPRIAGVSSFGLSGTNVHLVIAEPPDPLETEHAEADQDASRAATLLILSAKSREALAALAGRHAQALGARPEADIAAFAAAASQKRAQFAHRLALVAATPAEAAIELERFSRGDAGSRARTGFVVQLRPPRIGWLFSDAQPDAGRLAELHTTEPAFRAAYDAWLAATGPAPELTAVSASVGFQFALSELWRAWGIPPAVAVCNQSRASRIAAALVAGTLRLPDAAALAQGSSAATGSPTAPLALSILSESLPDLLVPGQALPPGFLAPADTATSQSALAERAYGLVDHLIDLSSASASTLLGELAVVYLAGATVNWKGFHHAGRDDPAPLPNYPFQRTRYWPAILAGSPQPALAAPGQSQPEPDDGLYRIEWRPVEQPLTRKTPDLLGPSPSDIITALRPLLFKLDAAQNFADIRPAQRELDDFAIAVISATLVQLQPKITRGTALPANDLAAALGAVPAQARLLQRMFSALQAHGLAEQRGGNWIITGILPRKDLAAEIERLRRTYPGLAAEIDFAARAPMLIDVLRGRTTGVNVLFPNGSFALLDALYRDSSAGRLMNRLFGDTVAELVRPAIGPLRILEIGAGTGSTTASVLPCLPPDADYTFTDLSPAFLVTARAAFAARPVNFQVLDIESVADVQALAARPFNIVLAANVLHATRDLRQTLAHVRTLLRPGGTLVLLEGTETLAITDITLGMLDGWWKYDDAHLRSSGPLLDQVGWRALLDAAGFDVGCLPKEPAFGGITQQQTIIVARARLAPPVAESMFPAARSVILLHRDQAAAADAERALEAAGLAVHDIPVSDRDELRTNLEASCRLGRDTMWIYLAAQDENGEDPIADATAAIADLLTIAQAAQNVSGAASSLCIATTGAQPANATIRPAHATLWGFGRALVAEAPGLRLSLIDLDPGKPDWNRFAQLLTSSDPPPECAIATDFVLAPALAPVRVASPPSRAIVSPGASYIITGAFGVLGTYATSWFAEQGAGKLFLVGHNSPGTQALAAIEAARNSGVEIEIVVADIATVDGVEALFTCLEADPKPLRGIIHAAAVLDDAPIIRQTQTSFARAFGPKAAGAWLLHKRSLGHDLDFFVLYSSVAALIGPAGQSNYAAASCFIDALAHHRHALGLPAVSINWGLWSSVGAAIRRDAVGTGIRQGVIPITPEQGHAVLARALASEEAQLALMPLDRAVVREALGQRRPPTLLNSILSGSATGAAVAPASNLLTDYTQKLLTATESERLTLIVDFIRSRSAELLNFDPATPIPYDRPLLELGLDSLVGLELRNDLETLSGLRFPSTLFFDCPTINDLTQYLHIKLSAARAITATGSVAELEQVFI